MKTGSSNWGGKRQGAGRPKRTYSAHQVLTTWETIDAYSVKYGKTIGELLLEIIYEKEMYGEHTSIRDRITAIKMIFEYIMNIPDEDVEPTSYVSAVCLPEKLPDPAKSEPDNIQ